MKSILTLILLLFVSTFAAFAQNGAAEQEIKKIINDYDQAILKNDTAFMGKMFADDYVFSGPDGKTETKTQSIEYTRSAPHKMTAVKSDNVRVITSGNLAVVTADWTGTSIRKDDASAEPHTDSGRYTTVLEKRAGKWLIISDHLTEKPHTTEEMEPLLRKASGAYDQAMKNRDQKAFERLLADDYIFTNETGAIRDKKQDIEKMISADVKIETATVDDKKFRIYRSTAVETGRYTVTGTNKGKAFSETGRYTTTWHWRDGRWQMVADHTSIIK